ncbi:hypothetical protein [Glaciihabitans sp. dw_435]|uniref:hypothetical protein n=1 Tax=Glaciihabitans sp. dw_435 TaxID=2720081 RepID=UPI001BD69B6E|nr:hypothetical protein [Glaciihabitans sp. dw_435]
MANLIENVAGTVSKLGVKAAYGDKVTVDGVELVPVAVVQFGFGAGGDNDENGGGGGGGFSVPIGAYVGGPNGLAFRPNIIALLWVLVPLTWVGGRALSRVIRALKK